MESVDTTDLKSVGVIPVAVQVRPRAPKINLLFFIIIKLKFFCIIFCLYNAFLPNISFAIKNKEPSFSLYTIKSMFNVGKQQDSGISDIYALYNNESEVKNVDIFEKYNRAMFYFNLKLDEYVISYLADTYRYVPIDIRGYLNNLYNNINYTPKMAAYSLLQLDLEGFMITAWRFGINFTIGIFGLYDIASMFGLEAVDKSIDQTLVMYDIPSGPFLMLPLLGTSTLTNAFEFPIYILLSMYNPYTGVFGLGNTYSLPFSFLGETAANSIISQYFGTLFVPKILNARINFDSFIKDLNKTSIDGYVTLKDFYLQYKKYNENKENESIKNGRFVKEKPLPLSHHTRINEEDWSKQVWQEKNDDIVTNFVV